MLAFIAPLRACRIGQPRRGILLLAIVKNGGEWRIQIAQNTDSVAQALTRPARQETSPQASQPLSPEVV